jgi:putative addiction module component (TIGR02574 family)
MATTMRDLGIDQLSVADRITLVQEIWDSILDSPEQVPLTEAQKQILDKRIADLDANPHNVLTWDEIKARVRRQP